MKTNMILILLAASLIVGAGNAFAQKTPESVYGARVEIRTHNLTKMKGELIAVQPDSLWILSNQKLIALSFMEVDRVDLYRHRAKGRRFFLAGMAGGLASATALTAACSTVSNDCAGVFFGVAAVSTLATVGVTYEINSASRRRYRSPVNSLLLANYCRFPQGFPTGFQKNVAEISQVQP